MEPDDGLYKLDLDNRQTKLLAEEAVRFIEDWVNASDNWPKWEKAYIGLASEKQDGLYISLTEQEEFTQVISWNEFEECTLEQDADLLKRYLPRFKVLVAKIEEKVACSLR